MCQATHGRQPPKINSFNQTKGEGMTDKPEPIFKPGEEYVTRGRKTGAAIFPARVYVTNAGGLYPIHGAVFYNGNWEVRAWTNEGRSNLGVETPFDLMPPKPKPREVWIWEWNNGELCKGYEKTRNAITIGHSLRCGRAVKFREIMEDD